MKSGIKEMRENINDEAFMKRLDSALGRDLPIESKIANALVEMENTWERYDSLCSALEEHMTSLEHSDDRVDERTLTETLLLAVEARCAELSSAKNVLQYFQRSF